MDSGEFVIDENIIRRASAIARLFCQDDSVPHGQSLQVPCENGVWSTVQPFCSQGLQSECVMLCV